ncbi:hypothetical protein Tco_0873710 [Tanacetum coccineum]|uniref:Gag-Pol polyprotein n=1 Tax=Tanacetum coccineum TaxID=301880 RepID=A0ABQ5BL97_9ASTR
MSYTYAVKGNWGTAVKTSAGYNWRKTRLNFNCNSGSNFIRTDHPLKNMEDRGIFDSGCSGHMTEEFFTELQNLKTQENEAYSTGISEDTPEIIGFRRELDELAPKHLNMPELTIFNKPQKGIFDEASYDEEEEPKKISEALQDDSWVEAMQEELLQFRLQQLYMYYIKAPKLGQEGYHAVQVVTSPDFTPNVVKRILSTLRANLIWAYGILEIHLLTWKLTQIVTMLGKP